MDETKDNESITVDVKTGERSDDKPKFDIVEHDGGQKYIRADQVEEYKAHRADEYNKIQSELDSVLTEIDAIDRINAIEERQKLLSDFVGKNGDDYDMSDFIDFSDEQQFNDFMSYLQTLAQSSYSDPSAGFGPSKQPQSNTKKQLYKQGQENARRVFEGRR